MIRNVQYLVAVLSLAPPSMPSQELVKQACSYAMANCDITACLMPLQLTNPALSGSEIKLYVISEHGSLAPVFDILTASNSTGQPEFRPNSKDADAQTLCNQKDSSNF